MVRIVQQRNHKRRRLLVRKVIRIGIWIVLILLLLYMMMAIIRIGTGSSGQAVQQLEKPLVGVVQDLGQDLEQLEDRAEKDWQLLRKVADQKVGGVAIPNERDEGGDDNKPQSPQSVQSVQQCPYTSLNDLTVDERYPKATDKRHIIDPPIETTEQGVALVCCLTSKGPLSVMVHHSWAPYGARRFLDMIENGYFETKIPLFRCIPKFLCQFGLNGNKDAMDPFKHSIPDDNNWLPTGKKHRVNKLGVKRFQKGYLAYAGSGVNSRNLQFIVALSPNGPLGGGSIWEIPWGEIVGNYSFVTLDNLYTGYGENGPKQGTLWKTNFLTQIQQKFPDLDYLTSCSIVDQHGGQGEPGSTVNLHLKKKNTKTKEK